MQRLTRRRFLKTTTLASLSSLPDFSSIFPNSLFKDDIHNSGLRQKYLDNLLLERGLPSYIEQVTYCDDYDSAIRMMTPTDIDFDFSRQSVSTVFLKHGVPTVVFNEDFGQGNSSRILVFPISFNVNMEESILKFFLFDHAYFIAAYFSSNPEIADLDPDLAYTVYYLRISNNHLNGFYYKRLPASLQRAFKNEYKSLYSELIRIPGEASYKFQKEFYRPWLKD